MVSVTGETVKSTVIEVNSVFPQILQESLVVHSPGRLYRVLERNVDVSVV